MDTSEGIDFSPIYVSMASMLAPYLPSPMFDEIMDTINMLSRPRMRAEGFLAMLPHLSESQQLHIVEEATNVTTTMSEERLRVKIVDRLLRLAHLSPIFLDKAIEIAYTTTHEKSRAAALIKLIPYLHSPMDDAALRDAFEVACATLHHESPGDWLLPPLLPYLSREEYAADLVEIISRLRAIENAGKRAEALTAIASCLPYQLRTEVLEAARTITDPAWRASVLGNLVPYLPCSYYPSVVIEALDAFLSCKHPEGRYQARSILASQLTHQFVESLGIDAQPLWQNSIRRLAARGRHELLDDLVELTPWLEALATPDDLAAIAQSIVDVSHCWP
jgi:hypothetical protein